MAPMRIAQLYVLTLMISASAHASPWCERAPAELAHLQCSATQNAVIYAAQSGRADQAAAVVDAVAENFVRYFGKRMPRGAVAEVEQVTLTAQTEQALRKRGAQWVLVLPRGAGALPADLQARVRERLKDRSEADIANAMKQLEQQLEGLISANDGVLNRGLRYRIAHAAIHAHYWPKLGAHDAYGTPAPDWIDEAVATLFDDAATAAGRRSQLASSPVALSALQARAHPAQPMLGRAGGSGEITVRRVDANDAAALAQANPLQEAARLQAFAHSWAAYLIERDPRALASLYGAMAQGQRFEAWLAAEGKSLQLASTALALEQDWHAWLAQRQGN
jgi:hypothetical protein